MNSRVRVDFTSSSFVFTIRDSRECSLKKEQLEIKIKISAVRFAAKLSIETLPFSKFQDFRVTSQQERSRFYLRENNFSGWIESGKFNRNVEECPRIWGNMAGLDTRKMQRATDLVPPMYTPAIFCFTRACKVSGSDAICSRYYY